MRPQDIKIGIVQARFNEIVTEKLLWGAQKALQKHSILTENIIVQSVAGSFELPLAAQLLIDHHKVHGVIAIGAVLRGATDHYNYVCSATASGLMNAQLSRNTPIGFAVLTCDTLEQAFDRCGGKLGNKGTETAETVLEMILMKGRLTSNIL